MEEIRLTQKNKELLSQVLLGGMSDSYYEHDETPAGKDISGYINQELDTISPKRAEEIADYYSLTSKDLWEIISDEKECEEWLKIRACPWDDPW